MNAIFSWLRMLVDVYKINVSLKCEHEGDT